MVNPLCQSYEYIFMLSAWLHVNTDHTGYEISCLISQFHLSWSSCYICAADLTL